METPGRQLKSVDVYRAIALAAKPWASALSFRRLKGGAMWGKELGEAGKLFFWFQCNKEGWLPYGGRFTLNFELSRSDKPEGQLMKSERFTRLLDDDLDGDSFVELQNAVIAKLPPPGKDPLGENDAAWAANFRPLTRPPEGLNAWMRYYDLSDVEQWWSEFLLPRFPRLISRFLDGDQVDPSYPTVEEMNVSLRGSTAGELLLIPHSAARSFGQTLRTLAAPSRRGLILKAKTGEHIFELSHAAGVTVCRSGVGKEHRLKVMLSDAGLQQLVTLLESGPSSDPFQSHELGALRVWHHGE